MVLGLSQRGLRPTRGNRELAIVESPYLERLLTKNAPVMVQVIFRLEEFAHITTPLFFIFPGNEQADAG